MEPWYLWHYQAKPDPWSEHPLGVVDGDTLDVLLDQGFYTYRRERIRLRGIDTAEIWGVARDSAEYERGVEQAQFVHDWIVTATETAYEWPLIVRTEKDDRGKFGRLVAEVIGRSSGRWLTDSLKSEYPEVADE